MQQNVSYNVHKCQHIVRRNLHQKLDNVWMNLLMDRMNAALKHAGMKKIELARGIPVARTTVGDWCSGKIKSLTGPNLFKAARILGVNPEWLGTGNGSMLGESKHQEMDVLSDLEKQIIEILRQLPEADKRRMLTVGAGFHASKGSK